MYYYKEFSQCDGYLIYAKTDIHISVNKNWKNIFPLGDIQKSRDAGEGERGGGITICHDRRWRVFQNVT